MSDTRKVLRVSGPDTEHFLQGLVTNDVALLKDGLVYAALLTPQGKYRADFFLVPDGEDILVDVAEGLAEGLARALTMYKLPDVAIYFLLPDLKKMKADAINPLVNKLFE